jgi:hypothetical protein
MPEPGASLVSTLASHGIMGVVCAVLFVMLWQRDKALTDERAARIADAKAGLELALRIQQTTQDTVAKLSTLFEELKRLPRSDRT